VKPCVFIASSVEGLGIAYSIQGNLDYEVESTVWSQGVFGPSAIPIESLLEQLNKSDFGIFVFTADDVLRIRDSVQNAVRDNVLFEYGLFIGKLGRKRNFIVHSRDIQDFRWPTDLGGLTPVTFDSNRQDNNLRAALGAACNEIREAIKALGPITPTVEAVVSHLDDSAISVFSLFGKAEFFSRPESGGKIDPHKFDTGLKTLQSLKCIKFHLSDDGKMYSYNWTELGKLILTKYGFDKSSPVHPQHAPKPVDSLVTLQLSLEAASLLFEAKTDAQGTIMKVTDTGGTRIQTNNKGFGDPMNPRSVAIWKAALEELLGLGLLDPQGYNGVLFKLNAAGYKAADQISGEMVRIAEAKVQPEEPQK
jgi:Predicted nucleotide-binding protein containing TIR-like domain